jgi:transposase
MKQLTADQVAQKLTEGRNYKRLYTDLKVKYDQVTGELKAENVALRALVTEQQATIETLKIQLAELQTMVFGKKKKPPMGGTPIAADLSAMVKTPRSKASYRRPVPPATASTSEVAVPLPKTCSCGGSFDHTTTTLHDRYEEDIPLPELTPDYQPHLVTTYRIERGICLKCGKATSGKELGGAEVSLGPNVRLLVSHLIASVGMSYAQVANLMLSLYGLRITDGEIAAMLQKQHQIWLPAYNQLKADIRAAPIRHYDETPWAIQTEGNAGYAWVMSAADSPNTLFHCATSRGAPHAKRLHGMDSTAVHISDDYQAYRTLPGSQQLCWVHLYRVIRDLRYNANLPKEQTSYVSHWYEVFAAIYQDLRLYLDKPYDVVVRHTQSDELWQRVQALATEPAPIPGEPDKLRKLKAQLLRAGQDRLFVCLPKDTPCDNNRAERDLRQLVLKRKRSFGSKTEKGAKALATVLSLCTTTWRRNPTGYFQQLALLGQ